MMAQMLPQKVAGVTLKMNALACAVCSGLKKQNVSKTWIVNVRDLNTQHLSGCSCVLLINPTTKEKEKQQRKVFFSFEGALQERRSVNHFPHLLCEPVGKSGRPVHNDAVTPVDGPFDVPELDVLPLPTDGRALELELLRMFQKSIPQYYTYHPKQAACVDPSEQEFHSNERKRCTWRILNTKILTTTHMDSSEDESISETHDRTNRDKTIEFDSPKSNSPFVSGHSNESSCAADLSQNDFTEKIHSTTESKRKLAKKLRNSGQPYVTTRNGQEIVREGRKMKPPCGNKCKFKCTSKITEDERKSIFEHFWNLGDRGKQRLFLAQSIDSVNPYSQYRKVKAGSTRGVNYAFYFELNSLKIRVCKLFFVNTLGTSSNPFRTLRGKIENNDDVESDHRGKHGKQRRLDPAVLKDIQEFIEKQSASKKRIRTIYNEYRAKCKKENGKPICYTTFIRVHSRNYSQEERNYLEGHDLGFEMGTHQSTSTTTEESYIFDTEMMKIEPQSGDDEDFKMVSDARDCSQLEILKIENFSNSEDETAKTVQETATDSPKLPPDLPKTEPTEVCENGLSATQTEYSPIDSFFSAMASSVKTLPPILQLQVKQKVSAAVFEAESAFISGNF